MRGRSAGKLLSNARRKRRVGLKRRPDVEQKQARLSRRSYPASTFEEALILAKAVQDIAAGQKVRRLTLFDKLGKSPDSGPSRQLVTNSSKYGLTKGSYKAEYIELTPDGRNATSSDVPKAEQLRARFKLAIEGVPPFKMLYENFKGNKLPAQAVLRDFLVEKSFKLAEVPEAIDTFILNAKFLGMLKPVAGAERLLPIEHVVEEMPRTTAGAAPSAASAPPAGVPATGGTTSWDRICFYVTPIGAPGSEQRNHADLFLSHIVEPALAESGLKVVRADHIGKPGMITAQVIEHIVRSKLVVADLSFHNPNVFYELSLRHACRLPTVQIIRAMDGIPFDLEQFRTIRIDTETIYTLVPQLETYKSEIANQVRRVLEDPDAADNPLSTFFPGLSVLIPALA
ncbi:MAG: hypothetical protein M3Z54_12655 [Gemmatimonadota bacterium]|nr:hypothetical protein [Gemmatimonadota bacterium]